MDVTLTLAMTRRDEVLVAATELFARHGFHAVGMRAIADAVGIRGSSLYHYFPSKLDLLRVIAVEATREFVKVQLADRGEVPSYAARVRQLMYDHVIYFHQHRLEEAVGLRELQELREHAPEQYIELQTIRRSYQDSLEQMVVQGTAKGEFDCRDPHMATLAVLGMINSVNDWYSENGRNTIEQVASAYADIAVNRILGAAR